MYESESETEADNSSEVGVHSLKSEGPQSAVSKAASSASTPEIQRHIAKSPKAAAATAKKITKSQDAQSGPSKPKITQIVQDNTEVRDGNPVIEKTRAKQIHVTERRQHFQDNQNSDHLSFACHLFPRLSESNLQFHDIYWNYDRNNQTVILRKRIVKVSKLLKLNTVRYEKRQTGNVLAEEFLAEVCLVDCRPHTNQQIVSNVHSAIVPFQSSRISFAQRSDRPSIVIRSNYTQQEVVLRIALRQVASGGELGRVDLRLLDEQGKCCIPNRVQSHMFGDVRLSWEVTDVPARLIPQTDCLPDVLICEESWVSMLAAFRQLMCDALAKMESLPQTTWLCDPVMATFSQFVSNKALVEIFISLLSRQKDGVKAFRRIYMTYILPLLDLIKADSQYYSKEKAMEIAKDIEKNPNKIFQIFSDMPQAPLNVFDYTIHLSDSSHVLD
ncbi:nephrocystin-1-like protein [Ditylenchus destructor]|uniref:Nephrocystin-1-like protein n=1 Tax=Ditylenchus destructor TaxID=166010 RepID=A0AAD4NKE3_9BILA|nr:nephrocystin-1-like protein [Ditylenchus destructor]